MSQIRQGLFRTMLPGLLYIQSIFIFLKFSILSIICFRMVVPLRKELGSLLNMLSEKWTPHRIKLVSLLNRIMKVLEEPMWQCCSTVLQSELKVESWLGHDKIIVWFRLHTAQKVRSVGRKNILFWTKILCRPLLIYRVKWHVQNSEVWHHSHTHTHTECSWQHAILSLSKHGKLLFTKFHYISD